MERNNRKKRDQLGQPHGTATHKLRKIVMFDLLTKLGLTSCFRCAKSIETVDSLSIEHKEPWLDSPDPIGRFFDITNIGFSHLFCNVGAARRTNKLNLPPQALLERTRERRAACMRRIYTPARRRAKYVRTGY